MRCGECVLLCASPFTSVDSLSRGAYCVATLAEQFGTVIVDGEFVALKKIAGIPLSRNVRPSITVIDYSSMLLFIIIHVQSNVMRRCVFLEFEAINRHKEHEKWVLDERALAVLLCAINCALCSVSTPLSFERIEEVKSSGILLLIRMWQPA